MPRLTAMQANLAKARSKPYKLFDKCHAGNLILLCKFHHDNYGRRLTRTAITQALQGDNVDNDVRFGADGDAVKEVKGRQTQLEIPDTGEVVKIFFTVPHSDYWLCQAQPLDDSKSVGLGHPVNRILAPFVLVCARLAGIGTKRPSALPVRAARSA